MTRAKPRKRLSRMDAAVDAMMPYGFAVEKVLKIVKELLKEYGGVEGWPFIEDCSYKELVEAILRDAETDDPGQGTRVGDQIKDQSGDGEESAGPSRRASGIHQEPEVNFPLDIVPVAEPTCPETGQSTSVTKNAEADGNGWKDILPDQTIQETANPVSEHGKKSPEKVDSPRPCEMPALPSEKDKNSSLAPPKRRRRMPCYGWIESDEDDLDDDFVILEPGPMVFRVKAIVAREVSVTRSGGRRVHKSRWDEKPDDP